MELGFTTQPARGGTNGTAPLGDWPGLRARLIAAHVLRRSLLDDFAGATRIEASFAPAAAQALAASPAPAVVAALSSAAGTGAAGRS